MVKKLASTSRRKRDDKLRRLRLERRRRFVALFIFLSLISTAAYYTYNSTLWTVKSIVVIGNDNISYENLISISEISSETTLLKFPGSKTLKKIKKNPWVKNISFSRRLPGTLIVNIEEKTPIAVAKINDVYYLIDDDRRVITTISSNDDRYPLVEGLDLKEVRLGQRLSSKALKEVIEILDELPMEIRETIEIVSIPKISKIALITDNNIEIVYGPAEEMRKKNRIIQKILDSKGDIVIYINVSIPDNPVTRRL